MKRGRWRRAALGLAAIAVAALFNLALADEKKTPAPPSIPPPPSTPPLAVHFDPHNFLTTGAWFDFLFSEYMAVHDRRNDLATKEAEKKLNDALAEMKDKKVVWNFLAGTLFTHHCTCALLYHPKSKDLKVIAHPTKASTFKVFNNITIDLSLHVGADISKQYYVTLEPGSPIAIEAVVQDAKFTRSLTNWHITLHLVACRVVEPSGYRK